MIEIDTNVTTIETNKTINIIDVIVSTSEIVEIETPSIVIEITQKQIEMIEVQTIGPQGPPGQPGPPGGFEIIPITISAVNVWHPVPLLVINYVADVAAYDQSNREKVEIDVKINSDQTVEVRSKLTKTYNIHVSGI